MNPRGSDANPPGKPRHPVPQVVLRVLVGWVSDFHPLAIHL